MGDDLSKEMKNFCIILLIMAPLFTLFSQPKENNALVYIEVSNKSLGNDTIPTFLDDFYQNLDTSETNLLVYLSNGDSPLIYNGQNHQMKDSIRYAVKFWRNQMVSNPNTDVDLEILIDTTLTYFNWNGYIEILFIISEKTLKVKNCLEDILGDFLVTNNLTDKEGMIKENVEVSIKIEKDLSNKKPQQDLEYRPWFYDQYNVNLQFYPF